MPAACAAASASATSAATITRPYEGQARSALALRDVFALEPLHRDVGLPVVELTERDDLHDPGVTQAREHAALAPEPRLFARVDPGQRDDLERDGLSGDLVPGPVDDPDAPTADLALDDEAPGERLRARSDHARFPEPTDEDLGAHRRASPPAG